MNAKPRPDAGEPRQRELIDALLRHMDRPARTGEMAEQVFLSRFHFQRVFRRTLGETPKALRRRLLLERAAFDLRATEKRITEIAFDANYGSLEGFSRAFRGAYGLSPSEYRRAAQQIRLLPGSSGVHYDARTRGITTTLPGGKRNMDLMDRLFESDYTSKRRILECARLLSDAQLDAPLAFRHNLMPFVEPARTLRESLAHIAWSGWVDMMFDAVGWAPDDTGYRQIGGNSPAEMIARLEGYHRALRAFAQKVRAENLWDREWVDDACQPPETFSIGTVLEAQLSWDIAYRTMLERQMEQMGFRLHEIAVAETE
jgi:AraC-like DNA-binding protein